MQVSITEMNGISPDAEPLEIVERKGLGHPDTVCDRIAEAVSIGLSRHYLERFGVVLHHNVDKALLIGGAATPAFGGGSIDEPIEIVIAGRATRRFGGVVVSVDAIAEQLAREWLARHLPHLAPGHVRIVPRIRETSRDLNALFLRRNGAALANDTSFGVGYAPLDRLERTVLAVERCLASDETRRACAAVGDDVKVLGWRDQEALHVLVACAFVDRHVRDLADYVEKKGRVRALVRIAAEDAAGMPVHIELNGADGDTADSIYLTVSGLSAEAGDDGEVGRGNRVNGLITPYRPMSLEAAAGKNPISHTGKLYNLLAERVARTLVETVAGVEGASCWMLSRIGSPVDEPQAIDVRLRLAPGIALAAVSKDVRALVAIEVREAGVLWHDVLAGRCPVC